MYNFTRIAFHWTKKWSKSVVSWFSYTIGISDVFANCIYLDKCKWLAKLCIFIICFGIWPNKDIDKRIYSGTGDKWHNIAVISLMSVIGHRTSLWLYDSLDSVMEAVTKSPYSRLVAYSLDRLSHSPNLDRLHLHGYGLSPEGRDGRQSTSQQSWRAPLVCANQFLGGLKWIDFPTPRCHPCTLHRSDWHHIGFWSSCPFQNVTEM